MRSKVAVVLAILGLVLLGLGIGQRTLWAPPATVTASVAQGAKSAPVAVIDPAVRTLHGSPVTIAVKSDGPILLAAGRSDDVDAWVGKAAHLTVTGADADFKVLSTKSTDGEATVPNPAGSDLWTYQQSGTGTVSYEWTPPVGGNWSLLVASDGSAPAPTDISVTAPNDTSTPWAVPLMVIGALLLIIGVLLLIFRPKKGRRSATTSGPARRGPNRTEVDETQSAVGPAGSKKKEPVEPAGGSSTGGSSTGGSSTGGSSTGGSGRTLFARRAPLAAAAALLLLTGAVAPAANAASTPPSGGARSDGATGTASGTSAATTSAPGTASVPVVLESQFNRILDAVATTVTTADAAKDANQLPGRVGGSALELRTANYKIRSQVADYAAVTPVASSKLLTKVISTSLAWPRSIMAVTQGEANTVPQLLTMVQTAPRENYKLDQATPLLPGQTFPAVDKKGVGTLAMDDKSALQMSPTEALAALGDRLTKPDSAWKDKITDPVYIPDVDSYQADIAAKGPDATYIFSHTPVADTGHVLRTADGGALVSANFHFNVDATSKADAKLTVGPDAAVFTGGTETTKGFVLNFGEPVVLYVPPAGSQDKMVLLSATRGLIGASFK
ncbi:hypothetical protein IV500_20580 [Paeniglutamicibacter antarcticus]|uniref:DUF8094 domain-containing protein n=1 Tax=Arthrobacter terrae TaxID=2935737 RepID=A0A931CND8_9MICC|nr:hypothetical protein [Arthrobacter terrae]MBG0741757.1 hypothetical protein [Arthrobacter terrae]